MSWFTLAVQGFASGAGSGAVNAISSQGEPRADDIDVARRASSISSSSLWRGQSPQDDLGGYVTLEEALESARQAEMIEQMAINRQRGYEVRVVNGNEDYDKDRGYTSSGSYIGNDNDAVYLQARRAEVDRAHREALIEQFHAQALDSAKDCLLSLNSPYELAAHGAIGVTNELGAMSLEAAQLYDSLTRERGGFDPVSGRPIGVSGLTTERGQIDPVSGRSVSELRGETTPSASSDSSSDCVVQ